MMQTNVEKKKNILVLVVLVVAILLLVGLLLWNALKDDSTMLTAEYETKQLELFSSDFKKQMDYVQSSGMSGEEGVYYLNGWLNNNKSSYESNSVDLAAFELSNNLEGTFDSVSGLVETISSTLDSLNVGDLLSGLLGSGSAETTRTITLKSNTVCQSVTDSKYCVNKLSANVYISDVNSSKWVVLVHPFMTSGSLIYNSIGGMYEEQGYNVIAPDLRGFGNSDGSVAMGYLESLDVYDWIKDLNENWNNVGRYGVSVAPDTIVVHGISLGGATTLQLATNPDIAAANGNEPYTKTLTQLNVKGFVDDCGYTSMSGIITGMLGGGDINQLSSLLSSMGIDEFDFMSKLQEILKQYGITGFDFDFSNLTGGFGVGNISDKLNTFKDFSQQYDYLDNVLSSQLVTGSNNNNNSNQNESNSNPYLNGEFDLGNLDVDKLKEQYGGSYQIPDVKDYLNKYTSGNNLFFQSNTITDSKVTSINNSLTSGSGDFLDGLIGTVLMNLVGVGLTEDNYAKYSDVFSSGRKFPAGSKVVIIHGTMDTTVPHSNADTVAVNVAPATLIKKWDVTGAPHAFVIIGSKRDEYSSLVANFTDCIENASCKSIG